ncbi:LLM class flavin-dependent oxidoreductase [Kitasatospora cystarginea]|uniref:LLM class flavin-dependent oxidoreductase n=1 Tax=Kitasatospora cystarginea TaxID=58350 RepID=UPI003CD07216
MAADGTDGTRPPSASGRLVHRVNQLINPWLDLPGHSPKAWAILVAAAQATRQIPLMPYMTCPTMRYHPTVVAQLAVTVQLLSHGRLPLGSDSGEDLNEQGIRVIAVLVWADAG